MDRYQRHSLIDWYSQDEVEKSSFAIIGCGAVGNEVAKNLALLGVGEIDLFDFDTIEIHNLTRSVLFRETDIGHNKANVAANRLRELDPNIKVNAYPGDFWDLLLIEKIKEYDCVICCVDNFEARIRLNNLCLISGTNLINTGIDSKFGQIEIFPFKSGKHIACYECNLPHSAYQRIQNRYSCGWLKKIAFIEKKIPTTIITSSLTGSLAVANAINLIKNDSLHEAKRILIDTFTGNSSVVAIEQSSQCPACSSLKKNISILKASAKISNQKNLFVFKDTYVTTSDPILISYRCINCTPHDESTLLFERASKFDSSIINCPSCKSDSIVVNIKDSFSIAELLNDFQDKEIPAKFIRFDNEDRTIIIELEKM